MRLAAVATLVFFAACSDPARVEVRRADQVVLSAEVTVATSEEERAQGLRGTTLEPGEGLLIEMPRELELCIVNDGVAQDIDAVIASQSGLVVAVERGIGAGDPTPRCHRGRWILEVPGQSAAQVEAGDRLVRVE